MTDYSRHFESSEERAKRNYVNQGYSEQQAEKIAKTESEAQKNTNNNAAGREKKDFHDD